MVRNSLGFRDYCASVMGWTLIIQASRDFYADANGKNVCWFGSFHPHSDMNQLVGVVDALLSKMVEENDLEIQEHHLDMINSLAIVGVENAFREFVWSTK